jgi:hypothetical protein
MNFLGERLESLLHPEGRGRIPADLVRRYLGAVARRLAALGKPLEKLSDAEILAEIGVRALLIAAGRSSRFSAGLARKQLARGDGWSTLLLQARQAAGIHACADVIVVDPVIASRFLAAAGQPVKIVRRDWDALGDRLGMQAGSTGRWAACCVRNRPDDLPRLYRYARSILPREFPGPLLADAKAWLEDWAWAVVRRSVVQAGDGLTRDSSVQEQMGRGALLAVARPWGPGEAFLEGLRRLKQLGRAEETRYVMPIYADYAPALLPQYPPMYIQAYMEAVASPDMAITLGAKSPLDTVRDRGNIVMADGPHGPVPLAIREWRDMSQAEQAAAERQLEKSRQTGQPHHGLNAGVFLIDRAWAERQTGRIRREFDHPDPAKGKRHEYFYSDFVEIAARQNRPGKILFLGPTAPSGCKDVPRMLEFRQELNDAVRQILIRQGLHLDATARVRLRSTAPRATLEGMAKTIFGERPDSIHLFGELFLEDTVRVGPGTVLDGRNGPVELRGNTSVGAGVGLREVTAVNTCFAENPIDEFTYEPPAGKALHTPTAIQFSHLEDSYVAPGLTIDRSRISRSFVQASLSGAEVMGDLIVPDDPPHRQSPHPASGTKKSSPDEIPGAFRVGELAARDMDGVLDFIRRETEQMLRTKIRDEDALDAALEATRQLWSDRDRLGRWTPEQLYRHAFGWLRQNSPHDPFQSEKQSEQKALMPLVRDPWKRMKGHDFDDAPSTRVLFRDLLLLATRANLLDWQSPTVRALLGKGGAEALTLRISARDIRKRGGLDGLLNESIAPSLAIDDLSMCESLVLEGGPAEFLYLVDNTGEALFDGLVWDLFCQIGHRVIVAAKEKPAGGDATVSDILGLIRRVPRLRGHFQRRALQVISNGTDTYGTFLREAPEEFRAVYHSPALRAVIGKGQGNLYTTVARNVLKVPYLALFLVKGMTAERLTGVRALRRGGRKIPRPVMAVIPAGCRITGAAPGSPDAETLQARRAAWGG